MGLRYVRGLADALLDRIDVERERALFTSLSDFTRRTGAPTDALEALATGGAFGCFDRSRREALWAAGALRDARPDKLPGLVTGWHAGAAGHDRGRGDGGRPVGHRLTPAGARPSSCGSA